MWKMLALLLVGCSTAPSALEIEGDEGVVVHALGEVSLPAVQALDANGQPMQGDHTVVWSVTPDTVGRLAADGGSVELIGEGTATVTATIGTVTDVFTVTVALPDTVAIDTAPFAGLTVGQAVTPSAQVTADGTVIAGAPITWSVSDPAVATISEAGEFSFVAPGTVTLTATSGDLSASVELTAAPPATAEDLAAEGTEGEAM